MARLSSPLEGEGQYARQRLTMMALIPAAPSHAYNGRVAGLRRAWIDPPSRGRDRRLEGEPNGGLEIQEAWADR